MERELSLKRIIILISVSSFSFFFKKKSKYNKCYLTNIYLNVEINFDPYMKWKDLKDEMEM